MWLDRRKMIYILDSSAFIFGFSMNPLNSSYTTDEVIREVRKNPFVRARIETFVSQGSIRIMSPPKDYLSRVSHIAKDTADLEVLSQTDLSILALSLYLKENVDIESTLVSDDYAIQNMASVLGIPFKSLSVRGITKEIKWVIYCPACRKVFETSPGLICPICGHNVKRKPKEKSTLSTSNKF
jgi:UPF0271 protein